MSISAFSAYLIEREDGYYEVKPGTYSSNTLNDEVYVAENNRLTFLSADNKRRYGVLCENSKKEKFALPRNFFLEHFSLTKKDA